MKDVEQGSLQALVLARAKEKEMTFHEVNLIVAGCTCKPHPRTGKIVHGGCNLSFAAAWLKKTPEALKSTSSQWDGSLLPAIEGAAKKWLEAPQGGR